MTNPRIKRPGRRNKRASAAGILREIGWNSNRLAAELSVLTGESVDRPAAERWLKGDRIAARVSLQLMLMDPESLRRFQSRAGLTDPRWDDFRAKLQRPGKGNARAHFLAFLQKLGAPAPGARSLAPKPRSRDEKGRMKAFARSGRGMTPHGGGEVTVHTEAVRTIDTSLPAAITLRPAGPVAVVSTERGDPRRFLRF